MQRPLYVLSSGELGSDPDVIDDRLERVFRLAQTWKAVLLLDEADVFMAKRTATDLTRNAVVPIFLRQLEYYQGILILTTNRVEEIDDAFRSRIHFQLAYSDLDAVARKAIWRGFLGNVNKTGDVAVDLDGPCRTRPLYQNTAKVNPLILAFSNSDYIHIVPQSGNRASS